MSKWPTKDGQFLIVAASDPISPGAERHRLTALAVDTFGQVPIIPVRDGSDRLIGAVLGTPIDLDRHELPKRLTLSTTITAESVDTAIEAEIYRLAGSYIFVLDLDGLQRIYLDPDGSKSLVYDPATRLAGATAMTLMDEPDYYARLKLDQHRQLDVTHAGWFACGLTAHHGLFRLICNHYLDLASFEPVRHWPRAPVAPSADPAPLFDAILARIRETVEILRDGADVHVALTAGTDSRFVLSALRPLAQDIDFVTVAAPGAALDVAGARALAGRFNLRHLLLPFRRASRQQAEAWQIRAGHCVGGANMTMHPSVQPLAESFFIGGLGGEIGRGFLWLNAAPETPLDAANIIDRLKLPREPALLDAVAAWLAPIAHFDTLFLLDLAYLELRMSSWAFADAYANPVRGELHPMISRANFEAMLAVPAQMRREGTAFEDAIHRAWPDLLIFPINRYGDWRDPAKRALDILSNPRRVLRKLRQLTLLRRHAV